MWHTLVSVSSVSLSFVRAALEYRPRPPGRPNQDFFGMTGQQTSATRRMKCLFCFFRQDPRRTLSTHGTSRPTESALNPPGARHDKLKYVHHRPAPRSQARVSSECTPAQVEGGGVCRWLHVPLPLWAPHSRWVNPATSVLQQWSR